MKTNDSKAMFATMEPWKLFFIVALPGMISMIAMSIYNVIEGVFIGQKLGESAFAAVNIAFPIIMINFSLADLVGVGASVPISIALGRKDEKTANNIFSCSIIMIFLSSVAMGAAMLFLAEPLARLMGADEEIVYTAARYIRTYALCSPLTTVFFAMDNYLRISGFVKTSMIINVLSNVVTAVLLAVFLFAFEMDVVGSALAACISMCLCSIAALIPFLRGRAVLKFVKPQFSRAMIGQITVCGSPVFLSNIAGRVTSILMNISLMTLGVQAFGEGGGTTAVAAYSVLMYSGDMCQMLLYGMSDSLAPAIGYNWGAERYDRVKKLVKCNYIGAAVIGILTAALLFFLAHPIACIFVSAEEVALRALATRALRYFSFVYLLRWFIIVAQSFLSAIEKPVFATMISVGVALVFPVTTLAVLWPLGLDGIWFNTFGTTVLASILAAVLMLVVWRQIRQKQSSTK